jgi:hypothetical protein
MSENCKLLRTRSSLYQKIFCLSVLINIYILIVLEDHRNPSQNWTNRYVGIQNDGHRNLL